MVYITNMNDNQQINDDYIVSLFFTSKTNPNRIRQTTSYIIDNNEDIKNYLINRFPDFRNDFKEVLHRIKYNIEEIPKCPICGKPLKYYGCEINPGGKAKQFYLNEDTNERFYLIITKVDNNDRDNIEYELIKID